MSRFDTIRKSSRTGRIVGVPERLSEYAIASRRFAFDHVYLWRCTVMDVDGFGDETAAGMVRTSISV
jgi:hypothetical protein